MSDPTPDTLGDRLRLLGTNAPAPLLPPAEIRRRADRRRHRRHTLGAVAACAAAAVCLGLPTLLHEPGPPRGPATTSVPAPSSPTPATPMPSTATPRPDPASSAPTPTGTGPGGSVVPVPGSTG